MDGLFRGDLCIHSAADGDKAPVTTTKHYNGKSPKVALSRTSKTRTHEQEKNERTRKSNSKEATEAKQSGSKDMAEEKPTIPKKKWKKNQPQLSQDNFKIPQSSLAMHMLESVQGFHTPGRETDRKHGFYSSLDWGNSTITKRPQPTPDTKPWLNSPREGQGPEKTHVKAQKPEGGVEKECPACSSQPIWANSTQPGLSIIPLGEEKQPGSENSHLGKNSLSLEGQWTTGHETQPGDSFANAAAVVGDRHLPHLFSAFKDLDQFKGPEEIKAKGTRAIELNQVQERSHTKKRSSGRSKNKHKASEPLSGAPKAKIQPQDTDGLFRGDLCIHSVVGGDKAPVTTTKHSNDKSLRAASSRTRKSRSHEEEKTERTRKINPKEAAVGKQSGSKVMAEEKPTIPKMKWKKNQP
ncbi:hypothetical protein MUG91_G431n2 [Manis pentadactyla]|nr:hypothetical protein MUG91_G431n2 [Manis pentadactyla]